MMRKRTRWLLVLILPTVLLPLLLCGVGGWLAFRWLNRPIEPILVEVVAGYAGASPEEVERQITIPLEVALAGMPRLVTVRSRSSFGQCQLRLEFGPGTYYEAARQEVINRLQFVSPLPPPAIRGRRSIEVRLMWSRRSC